jgi:hypothetical protein
VVIEMLDGRPPYSNISNNAQETIRLIVSGSNIQNKLAFLNFFRKTNYTP